MPASTNHHPNGQTRSPGGSGLGLPYKFFKWADDQEQDEMIAAAQEGRLDAFIKERYGDPPHPLKRAAPPKLNQVDLASFAGRSGSIDFNGLTIRVRILEARLRYGHIDVRLTPEAGEGERWVEHRRVCLDS